MTKARACWLVVILGLIWVDAASASEGEYLFHIAGCVVCHTAEGGVLLAGGRAFVTAYGTFYSPNITPDEQTGIGNWSKADFIKALKRGRDKSGAAYFPVFPYPSYRSMTDADAGKIYDYLLTREPKYQPNRAHDLAWWLSRWMMRPWQWWFLDDQPVGAPESKISRGRYLVDALGHCGECHTPRDLTGRLNRFFYLAGTPDGPDGDAVPNITPHRRDGIGKWDADDLDYFLQTGELPDGDYVGGAMVDVVDNATSTLTREDRQAMVAYLRSITPIPNPTRRFSLWFKGDD